MKNFDLSEEDINMKRENGVRILNNRISWAKTYLYNAKLIEYPSSEEYSENEPLICCS